MSEPDPGDAALEANEAGGAGESADVASDVLAARLRTVQRELAGLEVDHETRNRLNARFAVICTSLKVPGADRVRGLQRLDELMADARSQRRDPSPAANGDEV
jgi:hypothetical protein